MPGRWKRYLVLLAAMLMLICLGGSNAWGAFVPPLKAQFGLSDAQTGKVATTSVMVFCIAMIFAGRLQDRWGPRPLSIASAILLSAGYLLAWRFGADYFFLWLGIGLLAGLGAALGYVGPIAAAVKWFPNNKGLVCGLAAGAFGSGAIAMKTIAQSLHNWNWHVLDVFGAVGMIYGPIVLLAGLMLFTPRRQAHEDCTKFRRRTLLTDRRFWLLFVGMIVGTYPYLTVMYNAEKIGGWFNINSVALLTAIPVIAIGNVSGRLFWGYIVERVGKRTCMLVAQAIAVVSMITLLACNGNSAVFLAAGLGVGFCYGSNFVIYPATIAGEYGSHVLGSIYPFVMLAQGISSLGPTINGSLFDSTGSYVPGLLIALAVPAAGLVITAWLSRPATVALTNADVAN